MRPGQADVGRIGAIGKDLGRVKVPGDLGEIDAGDADTFTPAIGKLDVRSMGRLAPEDVPTPESAFVGGLTKLRVRGDLDGVSLLAFGGNGFGHLRIDDDALGGGRNRPGIFTDGNIGLIEIGGNVAGSAEAPFTISARGLASAGLPTAIAAIAIGGQMENARILAGYLPDGSPDTAAVRVGSITVGASWLTSSLAVGVSAGPDDFFGTEDDVQNPGGSGTVARIARVVVKGAVLSTGLPGDHFGIVAEELGKLKIGGTAVALTPGPRNDLDGVLLGATDDMRAREVGA